MGPNYIGHGYIGHNYIGHVYIDHNYIGHNYMGHTYIGHTYIGHNYMGHTDIGHNYIGHNYIGVQMSSSTSNDELSAWHAMPSAGVRAGRSGDPMPLSSCSRACIACCARPPPRSPAYLKRHSRSALSIFAQRHRPRLSTLDFEHGMRT